MQVSFVVPWCVYKWFSVHLWTIELICIDKIHGKNWIHVSFWSDLITLQVLIATDRAYRALIKVIF